MANQLNLKELKALIEEFFGGCAMLDSSAITDMPATGEGIWGTVPSRTEGSQAEQSAVGAGLYIVWAERTDAPLRVPGRATRCASTY